MKSKTLIIFEGPDGGGKTTAARATAEVLGAEYVHLGPYRRVREGLTRLYVEAMMPAVLGYSDVVMDRSWLSEIPYGQAFRGGLDRIKPEGRRLLERLALRCRVVVVRMLPPFDVLVETFGRRANQEMLDNSEQLRAVHDWYSNNWFAATSLPSVSHDYSGDVGGGFDALQAKIQAHLAWQDAHPLKVASAGLMTAPILIVGDSHPNHHDGDPLYQWPFGSLSGIGCSRWLARKLDSNGISENQLCWTNSDISSETLLMFASLNRRGIIALGDRAAQRLDHLQVKNASFKHPQYWRRYHDEEPYPAIDYLKELAA